MIANEVRTRTALVYKDEHGIARVTILPDVDETLADAQENERALTTVRGNSHLPMLVDMRSMKSQTRESRQHYGSPAATRGITAVALLVESRVSMLIANFFIAVVKTTTPTKIFTVEAEAVAWLKGFPSER